MVRSASGPSGGSRRPLAVRDTVRACSFTPQLRQRNDQGRPGRQRTNAHDRAGGPANGRRRLRSAVPASWASSTCTTFSTRTRSRRSPPVRALVAGADDDHRSRILGSVRAWNGDDRGPVSYRKSMSLFSGLGSPPLPRSRGDAEEAGPAEQDHHAEIAVEQRHAERQARVACTACGRIEWEGESQALQRREPRLRIALPARCQAGPKGRRDPCLCALRSSASSALKKTRNAARLVINYSRYEGRDFPFDLHIRCFLCEQRRGVEAPAAASPRVSTDDAIKVSGS